MCIDYELEFKSTLSTNDMIFIKSQWRLNFYVPRGSNFTAANIPSILQPIWNVLTSTYVLQSRTKINH